MGKKMVGPKCFFSGPTKNQSLQIGKKIWVILLEPSHLLFFFTHNCNVISLYFIFFPFFSFFFLFFFLFYFVCFMLPIIAMLCFFFFFSLTLFPAFFLLLFFFLLVQCQICAFLFFFSFFLFTKFGYKLSYIAKGVKIWQDSQT